MNFALTVVVFIAILTLAKTEEENTKIIPDFIKSSKKLQRGPLKVILPTRAVRTKWIRQKLDHFDKNNNKTWQMRYMVNKKYFKAGGPMFIYLGGEWSISPCSIKSGIFHDLVKEHKGILFHTEHRYYGESRPTNNLLVENLQYLHVKQALADLAHFIRTQRKTNRYLTNSKVIISGCSYAASMVVWFSKLYPELVNGGWASSAPILAQVDFKEYMEVVGQAWLELGSQQCYNRVKNGIDELEAMLVGQRSAEVKATLKLCDSFDHHNDLDLWSLFDTISNIFSSIVLNVKEGDISFHCHYLMSFEDDLTAISKFFLQQIKTYDYCVDVSYNSTLNYYLDSSYAGGSSRPWIYQKCNEFGWFKSPASRNQPFGTKFPSILYTTLCYDIFGRKYTNQHIHRLVAETNEFFGGKNPQVKNVYMTQGALDPWRPVGQGAEKGAAVIPRASHCADFGSISKNDSVEMRASKKRLVKLVRKWLA